MPRATRPLALMVLALGASAAHAQGVPELDSVRATPAPNNERRGVRTGPVVTYLSVGVRGTYNDNIYAERDDPEADYVARVRPRVQVRTRHRRHGAKLTLDAEAARHLRNPQADVIDYGGRLTAHLDIGRATRLGLELDAQQEHEDRASPDDPDGAERTPIRRYAARLEAGTRLGRLGMAGAGSIERLDFTDVPAADGTGVINNDDRDRVSARVAGRLSYGLSATYEPFIQGAYNIIRYDAARDDNGFARDASGFELAAGARYRPNGFTVAEARLGYRKQRLADARLGPVAGLTGELALRSNLTPHTTLDLEGHRLVQQSTLTNASAFFSTRGRARIDHRPWSNVVLGADAALTRHTFAGIQREDTLIGAGVDARYDPAAFLRLTADYGFTRRLSTTDAAFTRNRFTLGAELRY